MHTNDTRNHALSDMDLLQYQLRLQSAHKDDILENGRTIGLVPKFPALLRVDRGKTAHVSKYSYIF